jgi:hypothetical protein
MMNKYIGIHIMHNFILLASVLALSSLAFTVQAKPVTQQMHACNSNNTRTISTNCKNQAAGFTLRYNIKPYGDYGSVLRIENPTSRNIRIYRVELLDGYNEQCGLDNWGPDGETIYAKSYFKVMTGDCKPERILQYVFIQGNKRYVF